MNRRLQLVRKCPKEAGKGKRTRKLGRVLSQAVGMNTFPAEAVGNMHACLINCMRARSTAAPVQRKTGKSSTFTVHATLSNYTQNVMIGRAPVDCPSVAKQNTRESSGAENCACKVISMCTWFLTCRKTENSLPAKADAGHKCDLHLARYPSELEDLSW